MFTAIKYWELCYLVRCDQVLGGKLSCSMERSTGSCVITPSMNVYWELCFAMLSVIAYWHLYCLVMLIDYCDVQLTAVIGYWGLRLEIDCFDCLPTAVPVSRTG